MHFLKRIGFTLLAAATFQTQAASVWKITSGENILYIGGTIHLLTAEDYPLPKAYEKAYQASDKVVFETNMDALTDTAFQRETQKTLSYTDGTTIDQIITLDTYNLLKTYLDTRNIPVTAIQHLKPGSLAMSLSMIELKHLGFTSEGVDQFYAKKATQDRKSKGWLEQPEAQIQMLDELNQQDNNLIVRYALSEIEEMSESIVSLRDSWRKGDMKALATLEMDTLKEDYPDMYQSLLVKRNNLWVPQIEHMLKDNTVEFIMVGAMHLAGPDSVLAKLKANGYKITQL
ncbi:conjugative transfer protein GumN [Marinomonas ushuaiensis DSM 15871]|uniref:Conjugative transfer protein GumN n=1 Tax=Marinomonas ushuaiensis DSM 15871 TaxID=1122207 RepID=X7E545_9GAMM|nr:TraB/GumN family protein [Marinomonas ushuaiensis]ETX10288.1 conjugative transfer protein GumN [Marinomonas ushuaiensis DSM 15871]